MGKKRFEWIKLIFVLSVLSLGIIVNHVCAQSVEQNETKGWDEWAKSISDYIDKFEIIMNKSQQMAIQSNNEAKEAVQKSDRALWEKVTTETGNKISGIMEELKALNPPAELKVYHEKIIDSYKYRKMANDTILKENRESGLNYDYMARTLELESIKELKGVYSKHNAPKEIVETLDKIIADYQQYLESQSAEMTEKQSTEKVEQQLADKTTSQPSATQ